MGVGGSGVEAKGNLRRKGVGGSEAERKGRLGRMEVVGPKRRILASGWCRPFESARLGVPQIGFRGVGGLGSEGWNGGTTAGR